MTHFNKNLKIQNLKSLIRVLLSVLIMLLEISEIFLESGNLIPDHCCAGIGMKLVQTLKVDSSCHAVLFVFLPFSRLLLEFLAPTHSGLPFRKLISCNDVIIYTPVEFINNMTSVVVVVVVEEEGEGEGEGEGEEEGEG